MAKRIMWWVFFALTAILGVAEFRGHRSPFYVHGPDEQE